MPREEEETMNILDGRKFAGVVLECGKTEGDADTLIFDSGRFRSTACDKYEYGDGAYTTAKADGGVRFQAQTQSPKYGKLVWEGVVRGKRLYATFTMVRDGKTLGEKWVLAGEK